MTEHRQKNPTNRTPNSVQITVLQPSQKHTQVRRKRTVGMAKRCLDMRN